MDWARLQYMPAHTKLGMVAGLVGIIGDCPTRLQHPLVYVKTRSVAGWAGLGHSTHQFA